MTIKGIGASPGIVLGKAMVCQEVDLTYAAKKIAKDEIVREQELINQAVQVSSTQLTEVYEKALQKLGEKEAEVFQAHQMLLMDPEFTGKMLRTVEEELISAPEAVDKVVREFAELFQAMDNEYMRERAADILDIGRRIIANLLGVELNPLQNLKEEVIIVARELSPSDTALMDKEKVLGFVTEIGGRTSHTAIMARSLEIPAVVGAGEVRKLVTSGETMILDGESGLVYFDPSEEELKLYTEKQQQYKDLMLQLMELKEAPAMTSDGHRVELAANIGSPADLKAALRYGAEGIGLFRTEFLYMDRTEAPSEEEQFAAYKEVAEAFGDKPVVIRTLDIGGDKELPYLDFAPEMNPFMGWRAIRFCLDRKEVFKIQLRALVRASIYGNIHIMYPFISGLEDLRAANAVLAEVKAELTAKGCPISSNLKVGIMMEIPSAALIADKLAKEVDFFSIGTNDLIQYTMAADRMNEKVSSYYQPFHPGVLRLIKQIVDGAHAQGIWVGMCGEMAGDPNASEILLGLGLDELSMSAVSLLKVKQRIRALNYQECKQHATAMVE